ncbi:MAG: hypothetical protein ACI8ZN_000296 [Bacteroidia bacterium]|jgi:hypothetical protein
MFSILCLQAHAFGQTNRLYSESWRALGVVEQGGDSMISVGLGIKSWNPEDAGKHRILVGHHESFAERIRFDTINHMNSEFTSIMSSECLQFSKNEGFVAGFFGDSVSNQTSLIMKLDRDFSVSKFRSIRFGYITRPYAVDHSFDDVAICGIYQTDRVSKKVYGFFLSWILL